jgi:hypothetical protein
MTNVRRLMLPLLAAAVGIAVEMAAFCCYLQYQRANAEVLSLAQVARLAEEMGLYARSDRADGVLGGHLIVSSRPITFERSAELHFGEPTHRCWFGTIKVSVPWESMEIDQWVRWKGLLLFGDPEIIQRLTGRKRPPAT